MKAPRNPNYAATVVALKDFVDLPNCSNVKAALIYGNHVIVAKSAIEGELGLFFPAETQLSQAFLANNNLFRKPELGNVDPSQAGFFEHHGRVKTMKFRGNKSEGFWIPVRSLAYIDNLEATPGFCSNSVTLGVPFDYIGDHEICRKYIPRGNRSGTAAATQRGKVAKLEDSIVDGQFRFHFDTENLRRNIHKVQPTDIISISDKWHGTSVVISKVLVKRRFNLVERVLSRLGVAVQKSQYGLTYSSRRVIKAVNGVEKHGNNFYSEDIWGVVAREVEGKIPSGFTLYGEIVGFTPSGEPIQKGYHYGCLLGEHKFLVYRVTLTTPEGKVVELGWEQMQEFCTKYGLQGVNEIWYGSAGQWLPIKNGEDLEIWQTRFLGELESVLVNDGMCPYNSNEVPAEGVVLRIDKLEEAQSFKLKNFKFLEWETKQLDKGEVDTETAESEELEQAA